LSKSRVHRRKSHRVRNFCTALGSLFLVGLIALTVIAPTRTVFAASLQASSTGIPGHGVVYGKVTNSSKEGLSNIRVAIFDKVVVGKKTALKLSYVARTNGKGIYRVEFRESRPTVRWVQFVDVFSSSKTLKSDLVGVDVKPGRAYEVSGKEIKSAVFTMLPVGSY